jgi:hypothetical protein
VKRPLTNQQLRALRRLEEGRSLRGFAHGIVINHLKQKRLIEDSDTISDSGRAALRASAF